MANEEKQEDGFTVRTLGEAVGRAVGQYAAERLTGRIVVTIDLRDGGIGRAGIEVSSKLRP